ncbi:MAG: hypothetical protein AABY18_06365 [Candidatus Thermoplasmatota archaeon]
MHWTTGGLLAIFDSDRGAFFMVVLVALLVGGIVLLVVNLSARPKPPAPPKWEAVADDESDDKPADIQSIPPGRAKPAPRRRA